MIMEKTREQIISEIKDILLTQHKIETLKEIISNTSIAAVRDLIQKNPNINLKTLQKSLQTAGHGGFKSINQQDIDGIKKQLGIQVTQPPQPPTGQPTDTKQSDAPTPEEIEKARNVTILPNLKTAPEEYMNTVNAKIAALQIPGVNDLMTGQKFVDDYDSIFLNIEKYQGLIYVLGEISDVQKYPSVTTQKQPGSGTVTASPGQQNQNGNQKK